MPQYINYKNSKIISLRLLAVAWRCLKGYTSILYNLKTWGHTSSPKSKALECRCLSTSIKYHLKAKLYLLLISYQSLTNLLLITWLKLYVKAGSNIIKTFLPSCRHRAWGNKLIITYRPILPATSVPDMLDLDYMVGSLMGHREIDSFNRAHWETCVY
jgi:hypothetical protein